MKDVGCLMRRMGWFGKQGTYVADRYARPSFAYVGKKLGRLAHFEDEINNLEHLKPNEKV